MITIRYFAQKVTVTVELNNNSYTVKFDCKKASQ